MTISSTISIYFLKNIIRNTRKFDDNLVIKFVTCTRKIYLVPGFSFHFFCRGRNGPPPWGGTEGGGTKGGEFSKKGGMMHKFCDILIHLY